MPDHIFSGFEESHPNYPHASIMLQRIRAFSWALSPAGPIEAWPEEIKSAVRLILLSPTAMAVFIGPEGTLIFNDVALSVLGARYARMLGLSVSEFPARASRFIKSAIDHCFTGQGIRFENQLANIDRGARERAWFNMSFTPIAGAEGTVLGVLAVVDETTTRVRAMRDLEHSRRRLDMALNAGGIVGTWDMDVRTKLVTTNQTLASLLGLPENTARNSDEMIASSVLPQDRDKVLAELKRSVSEADDFHCLYRALASDGTIRWFVVSGRPVIDKGGRVAQLAGIVVDITRQVETENALALSNLRFDILAEAVPQIVWSTDADGQHDYFNRRWSEFTGLDPKSIEPTTWIGLVHKDDWPRVEKTWQECLRTGETYDIDYRFRHHTGQYRWLKVLALPLRNHDDNIVRWYGTATDIDAAKRLEAQKELVANELDHRIKNLFALVNGLMSLSVRECPELEPLSASLRSRLQALAQAHALILGGHQEKYVSLRSLLKRLSHPYEGATSRISIDGPDIPLAASAATPIALIVHELLTNAAKYGALAQPAGQLSICSRMENDKLLIVWHELINEGVDGIPKDGFGSRLIHTLVEGQLRGRINRVPRKDGLLIEIDLPRAVFS